MLSFNERKCQALNRATSIAYCSISREEKFTKAVYGIMTRAELALPRSFNTLSGLIQTKVFLTTSDDFPCLCFYIHTHVGDIYLLLISSLNRT